MSVILSDMHTKVEISTQSTHEHNHKGMHSVVV